MTIIEQAYNGLFQDKEFKYTAKVIYSGKFNDYNANVKYGPGWMHFKLSREWAKVSDEIQIGLIQSLMLKMFRLKKSTTNIDLYNKFLKNVHIAAPKDINDPVLEEAFNRVNERFFFGMMDRPNLAWRNSGNILGRYEYGSDTITISRILGHDFELLDYVMYHEMLHKKYKFESKNGRTLHHSRQFREDEAKYPNASAMEERLRRVVTTHKRYNAKGSILGLRIW